MSGSKPIATLGPLLLARKGTAKPAMRASTAALQSDDDLSASQDDLGWNDMGDAPDAPSAGSGPVVRRKGEPVAQLDDARRARAARRQQAQAARQPQDSAHRAAFTLRLDAERHLKLKLASAVTSASAQQLVTQALDRFLAEMPEIEMLAAEIGHNGKKS